MTHKSFLRQKFPAASQQGSGRAEDLPRWNLDDLYPGLDSKELAADKEALEKGAEKFREEYESSIAYLTGPELGAAIAEYEKLQEIDQRIGCYVALLESDNTGNFSKTETLKKWQGAVDEKTGFFEDEIARMEERDLLTRFSAPELAHYAPWIARLRHGSAHDLKDGEVENLSQDFRSVNREAWRRLYYETLSSVRVGIGGQSLSLDEADKLLSQPGLDPAARREGRRQIAAALKKNGRRMTLIYNTLVKDTLIDTDLRGQSRPDYAENAQNGLSAEVVDAMHETVKASYAQLSHRFHAWKAQQHGCDVMAREQVEARLPDAPPPEDCTYAFGDAQRTILRAFRKFSPRFERIARQFFDREHIDAGLRPDKEMGAYSMPTGPARFPYIMVSYTGTLDSLLTLGHELGHGIHQAMAEKTRGLFLSEMSTVVSETASIFAEMLVFEELLRQEKDPAMRKKLLVEKTDNMLKNGLQQLSFYDFERRVHEERKAGELSVERISDIWLETQKQYWGPSVALDDYDRYYWMVVPHFFDSPFYVYSYSFAQQLVSGLYQVYKEAEKEGPAARSAFVENYIEFLETGITRNLYEMLQPFDLDPETPEFWKNGLGLAGKYIRELEKMDGLKPAPAQKKDPPPALPPAP